MFFKSGDVILDLGFGLQELSAKWLSVAGNNAKLVLKDFVNLEKTNGKQLKITLTKQRLSSKLLSSGLAMVFPKQFSDVL